MANRIYRTTRDGLTRLVSLRAATRVLERAMGRAGLDADTVEAEGMRRLLRGKVRRELEPILPRRGLHRHLKRIDREVKAAGLAAEAITEADRAIAPEVVLDEPAPSGADVEPAAVDAAVDAAEESDEALLAEADEPLPAPPLLTGEEDDPASLAPPEEDRGRPGIGEPAASPHAGPAPTASERGGTAVAVVPPRPSRPETAWQRIVEVEGVRRALLAQGGRLVDDRGAGPEGAVALDRVSSLIELAEKRGSLRSWHVSHGAGHVLVGAADDRLLLVQGSPELNLGAIYAAFAALEEET